MEILAVILPLAALALTGADWLQTLFIASDPTDNYHELNPILGRDPSERRVHVYFAACCAVELAVAIALAAMGYIALLCLLAAAVGVMEAYWVRHNWRAGIRI